MFKPITTLPRVSDFFVRTTVTIALIMSSCFQGSVVFGDPSDADAYFTNQVLPLLEANCFKCHGPEKQKATLKSILSILLEKNRTTNEHQ